MQFKKAVTRIITVLILSTTIQNITFAQKINYSIPSGYEKDISENDYKKIVDISVAVISRKYTIDFVKDGTIQLNKGQDMQAFNLDNLILKCLAVTDKSTWERVIQDHFDKIFSSINEQKKIDPGNYDSVKKYLSVRIYPVEMVSQRGGISALVARTDLEGTYTLLMLDLPGAFTPVSKQEFDLWKIDTTEAFSVALGNVDKQQVEKVTKRFDFEKANIEISFLGNEDYAASYALDLLNNSPELMGDWGVALAMPNKGLVDLCKISKDKPVDFVKFIQMTKPMIEKSYQDHPQPISDQYFWYYKGKFTRINVLTDAKGNVNVISPFGLTALMTGKN